MFSVIIPNYNREKSLPRAVNSVLKQSLQNLEVIVVDDCSVDDSISIISKYEDSRLRILKLEKNSGAAAARNFGIKHAKGEYISFLDSDDYYEPNFLENTYEELSKTREAVGFCWTGVRYFENQTETEYIWSPSPKSNAYLTFLNYLHIGTNSGITVKKEVFDKCGVFREDLPAAEDTEFFLRISQNFNYTFISKVLINIHKDGSDRLSKDFKKIAKAYNVFLPEHYVSIDRDKFLKSKFYYKMMWLNYHLGDKEAARKFYSKVPWSLLKGKLKALAIGFIYEVFPLKRALAYHQKISSI